MVARRASSLVTAIVAARTRSDASAKRASASAGMASSPSAARSCHTFCLALGAPLSATWTAASAGSLSFATMRSPSASASGIGSVWSTSRGGFHSKVNWTVLQRVGGSVASVSSIQCCIVTVSSSESRNANEVGGTAAAGGAVGMLAPGLVARPPACPPQPSAAHATSTTIVVATTTARAALM